MSRGSRAPRRATAPRPRARNARERSARACGRRAAPRAVAARAWRRRESRQRRGHTILHHAGYANDARHAGQCAPAPAADQTQSARTTADHADSRRIAFSGHRTGSSCSARHRGTCALRRDSSHLDLIDGSPRPRLQAGDRAFYRPHGGFPSQDDRPPTRKSSSTRTLVWAAKSGRVEASPGSSRLGAARRRPLRGTALARAAEHGRVEAAARPRLGAEPPARGTLRRAGSWRGPPQPLQWPPRRAARDGRGAAAEGADPAARCAAWCTAAGWASFGGNAELAASADRSTGEPASPASATSARPTRRGPQSPRSGRSSSRSPARVAPPGDRTCSP